MTGPDDEFRMRLLTTFREEAEEHLGEITQELIALEKAGVVPGSALVESMYRKTHSLKGAARAVEQREIESVCRNLETVFSVIKKGEFVPDADEFDLFHQAIKAMRALLAGGESTEISSGDIIRSLRSMTVSRKEALERADGERTAPPESRKTSGPIPAAVTKTAPGEGPGIPPVLPTPGIQHWGAGGQGPGEVPGLHHGGTPAPVPRDSGTVRIAAHKLDRLIAGSDDLLTTRLFITHRMQELEEMMTRFSIWRWNYAMVSSDVHQIREASFGTKKADLPPDLVLPLQRIIEFIEYDREFVTYLQHDLGAHTRETEIDRAALEASTSAISDLIHDAVLLPISSILSPFSGFVREFSRGSGKMVDLIIEGGEIEMDRRILDALKDPLMHLIHNSIDHGIEYPDIRAAAHKPMRGSVRIRVLPLSGSKVGIEVSDDGVGIDRGVIKKTAAEKGLITPEESAALTDDKAIWLIFRSGLSTNPIITDLSGRGLGLAIVEDSVTRLGGNVTVISDLGRGTTIRLTVPVRLATMRGVVVRVGNQVYVLPMQQVRQVIRIGREDIVAEVGRQVIRVQDEEISVIRLTEALGLTDYRPSPDEGKQLPVVILAYGAGQIACVVDEVIRVQEIVVRSLGSQLRRVRRITGAVILGDGNIALVLDPIELIQQAKKRSTLPLAKNVQDQVPRRILVVEDSVTSRALLQAMLEGAGFEVVTVTDGMEAFATLKEHEFDMVVSDVDMPRMNGFTLTEKIRSDQRLSRLPVVLVTSLDSREDQEHGVAIGADAYIVKSSFRKGALLEVIRTLMAGGR